MSSKRFQLKRICSTNRSCVFKTNSLFSKHIRCSQNRFTVFKTDSLFSKQIRCFQNRFAVFKTNSMFSKQICCFQNRSSSSILEDSLGPCLLYRSVIARFVTRDTQNHNLWRFVHGIITCTEWFVTPFLLNLGELCRCSCFERILGHALCYPS